MSAAPNGEALSRALIRAVVEHFGTDSQAEAEEMTLAGCTVVGSYIAGVRDPLVHAVLLAQAQWMLGAWWPRSRRSLPAPREGIAAPA